MKCGCDGDIYFGTLDSMNGTGDFKESGPSYKTVVNNWQQVTCDRGGFGGDPAYGYLKKCFCGGELLSEQYCATKGDEFNTATGRCERKKDPVAPNITEENWCAGEGQICNCTGTIYYGTLPGIMDVTGEAFRMHASDGSGKMCDSKTMQADGPFMRGHTNSCYCDGTQPAPVCGCDAATSGTTSL